MEGVRRAYIRCLEDAQSGKVVIEGDNNYSWHATTAYILAVCALEAFIGEMLTMLAPLRVLEKVPLKRDELTRLELHKKCLLVPYLLWGHTFNRGEEPFQSFATLIKLRNDLVHYEMRLYGPGEGPKYVRFLEAKSVLLSQDYDLVSRMCTRNGALWAHNTACETAQKLVQFAEPQIREHMKRLLNNFQTISRNATVTQINERRITAFVIARIGTGGADG